MTVRIETMRTEGDAETMRTEGDAEVGQTAICSARLYLHKDQPGHQTDPKI